jgi:hypothetical protein
MFKALLNLQNELVCPGGWHDLKTVANQLHKSCTTSPQRVAVDISRPPAYRTQNKGEI